MTDPASPSSGPRPIDLRIVVDGASTAGKTTTARSLGARLGRPVVTPEEHDGRTLLFDWMDHEGGRSDGRPIRTQVVAVPGHLLHLRARLLVTADVVLFVADTSASGMHASEVALAQVRTLLDAYEGERPGLVIQANKRDAPDALPMGEVNERLTREGNDPIFETIALTGDGVRQSYVYAVRLGLRHAKAVDGPRIAERQMTADALLRELDQDPRPVREIPRREVAPPGEGPTGQPSQGDAVGRADAEARAEAGTDEAPSDREADEVDAAATIAVASATVDPPVDDVDDDDQAPRRDRQLEAVGAGSPSGATALGSGDRPQHDHPRAWRRWFD